MNKKIIGALALCLGVFWLPLSTQAEISKIESVKTPILEPFDILSKTKELQVVQLDNKSELGILPSGTEFTFGVPLYTNEFSDDDAFEWVTIDSELQSKEDIISDSTSEITPFRIEPGWATYISKAYWITRGSVKSISIYPNKSAKGWTKEKAFVELKSNFSHYNDWKNETSLKKQFNCHARPIPPYTGKIPWNIEPSKSATNVLTCN